ncbi:class II histocompatibility antigen, B-L beta chain-like isoform X1 [Lepisosteus oculatus]|uniref:class II histocompatibility antigen, B-L beta chain-like isoform X1 n=1 Tax=Lepisosteus oculatus TaxID=7918 RepID=UPI0035F508A7
MWAQQALCRLQLLAVFSGFHWGHGDHRGVEGHVYQFSGSCQFSSRSPDDVVYVESYVFERKELIHYDSRAGQFVGYTEYGAKVAERWNSDPQSKARVVTIRNTFCKPNLELAYDHILEKTVAPSVRISQGRAGGPGQPTTLACHVLGFYPQLVNVTWLRGRAPVTRDVTSTGLLADGDWHYQTHTYLELVPRPGETLACRVEHSGLRAPLEITWEPPAPGSQRNQIVIGASGLVLGLSLALAGGLYYRKKSTGHVLVPTS